MNNIAKGIASLGVCAVAGILAWKGFDVAAGLTALFGLLAIWIWND